MAKIWVIEYEVTGHGTFPVDMLRYDASYPSAHAENLFRPDQQEFFTERNMKDRVVKLHHRDSFAKWEPTYDRWSSFGWVVIRNTVRHWST